MPISLKYLLVVFLWHSFLKCYEGSWMTSVFCVTKTIAILLDQLHNEPTIFPVTPLWYTSSAQSCRNLEPKTLVSWSVSTARCIGKKKRKKLDGSQEPCPVPSSSLEVTSAIAVLVAAKMLRSNVIVSAQGASFLLSLRQLYI